MAWSSSAYTGTCSSSYPLGPFPVTMLYSHPCHGQVTNSPFTRASDSGPPFVITDVGDGGEPPIMQEYRDPVTLDIQEKGGAGAQGCRVSDAVPAGHNGA